MKVHVTRKVHTKNSVYDVTTMGALTSVTKLVDNCPGGHPNVKVGDSRSGRLEVLLVGKPLKLVTANDGPFFTSEVTKIEH